MDQEQRDMLAEFKQLAANARENAEGAEHDFIDGVERRGWMFVTRKEAQRLQEIADR